MQGWGRRTNWSPLESQRRGHGSLELDGNCKISCFLSLSCSCWLFFLTLSCFSYFPLLLLHILLSLLLKVIASTPTPAPYSYMPFLLLLHLTPTLCSYSCNVLIFHHPAPIPAPCSLLLSLPPAPIPAPCCPALTPTPCPYSCPSLDPLQDIQLLASLRPGGEQWPGPGAQQRRYFLAKGNSWNILGKPKLTISY